MRNFFLIIFVLLLSRVTHAAPSAYQVVGDGIPVALSAVKGDAQRGRAIVANRQLGLCTLCHQLSDAAQEKFQGNVSVNLDGVGARLSEAQLRLRIVDNRRVNRQSIMPAFYSVADQRRVGQAWQAKTIFTAAQVEDVVAYLQTLK